LWRLKKEGRQVLTWTGAIPNCIRSAGNTAPQTDVHVEEDGRYVVSVDDGAQTVLSAAAAAAAVAVAVAVVHVVRVVLGVPWLPVLFPSVPFLRPVRL